MQLSLAPREMAEDAAPDVEWGDDRPAWAVLGDVVVECELGGVSLKLPCIARGRCCLARARDVASPRARMRRSTGRIALSVEIPVELPVIPAHVFFYRVESGS